MSRLRVAVIAAALMALVGCSGSADRQSKPRSTPPISTVEAGALHGQLDALTLEFINSLMVEQVRQANQYHRSHPDSPGTACPHGQGLGWAELNEAQQEMLRTMWETKLEMRAASHPGEDRMLSLLGPMEKAEIGGVGYAVGISVEGRETELYVGAQRGEVSSPFWVRVPVTSPLPPVLEQEGIDLKARGSVG